jgi:hypothetical protein
LLTLMAAGRSSIFPDAKGAARIDSAAVRRCTESRVEHHRLFVID